MARTKDPHAATVKAWKTRARASHGSGSASASRGDFARAGEPPQMSPKARAVVAEKMAELKAHQSAAHPAGLIDERATEIDIETGDVLYDVTSKDYPNDEAAGPDVITAMNENGSLDRWFAAKDKSTLAIHTHPGNDTSFSDGDWAVFSRSAIAESRVITNDAVYILRKSPEWDRLDLARRVPSALRARWNAIVDGMTVAGSEWTPKSVTVAANRILAKELGVSFEEMPRDAALD